MELGVTRKEEVVTAWAIEAGSKNPHLVTAYPRKRRGVNPIMISEYSKVRIITTGRIGTIVEFDNRKNGAIHLIELTDTDEDDRMVWADAEDLEELPDDEFPPLE